LYASPSDGDSLVGDLGEDEEGDFKEDVETPLTDWDEDETTLCVDVPGTSEEKEGLEADEIAESILPPFKTLSLADKEPDIEALDPVSQHPSITPVAAPQICPLHTQDDPALYYPYHFL